MATIKNIKNIRFAVLATDIVVFRIVSGELCVLLGEVNIPPFFKNKWGLIGGLILPQETAEEAADRLLKNKAGMGLLFKEQLYTFSSVNRDPRGRVVSVAHLALVQEGIGSEGGSIKTRWVSVKNISNLAYDHDQIAKVALERLRSKIRYTNIAQHLLPKTFTLSDLQSLYEKILDRKLDKRNFRKKVLKTKMLKKTTGVRKEGTMRPAALYEFAFQKLKTIDLL